MAGQTWHVPVWFRVQNQTEFCLHLFHWQWPRPWLPSCIMCCGLDAFQFTCITLFLEKKRKEKTHALPCFLCMFSCISAVCFLESWFRYLKPVAVGCCITANPVSMWGAPTKKKVCKSNPWGRDLQLASFGGGQWGILSSMHAAKQQAYILYFFFSSFLFLSLDIMPCFPCTRHQFKERISSLALLEDPPP